MQKRQIFRQVALERLSSPEQLDQLLQVTNPRSWLALLGLIALIVTVVGWSFSDTIPTEVVGPGILLRGGRVLRASAPVAGQVESILVETGAAVEEGQVVARIKPGAPGSDAQAVEVATPYSGRVVQIDTAPGSMIEQGATIVILENPTEALEAVIYMPPEQGKNVHEGMQVQVSPTNVGREEFGFIYGRVRSVATFPATLQSMMLVLGNEQLARSFLGNGTPLEVRIDLALDESTASGYRWSSSAGPPFPISSGTLCQATITLEEQRPINLVFPAR